MCTRLALVLSLTAPALAAQELAPFDAATLFTGDLERFVKTADLDGDGLVEAIGWWQISSTSDPISIHRMRGYRNDGTGRLAGTWEVDFTSPLGQWTAYFDPHESCEVADLDGDGDDDFVIAAGDHVDVWTSNGTLAPTLAITVPTTSDAPWRSVALADFDQDGDLDLAATRGLLVEIYDIDLAGGTLAGRASRGGGWQFGRLLAIECTGDGTPDLVVDGRRIFPFAAGAIADPIEHPFSWPYDGTYELRHDAGDIDGDGDVDVVTFRKHASQPTASYSVLRRTGPGTFVREATQSGGPARRLFDVDGDGDLDGVCCGGGGGVSYSFNRQASRFRIARNDGTGTFATAFEALGLGSTAIAGVADLDQDGRMDLVAGRAVWFQRQTIAGSPHPVIATRELLDCALADVDGDGDVDLEPRPWSVALNRGDAQVALTGIALPPPPVGERNGEGHWADWDGDGDADMLINCVSNGLYLGVELVRNRGNGKYESAGLVVADGSAAGFYPNADDAFAADVDGDGDLDFVRRNVTSNNNSLRRTRWWSNEGATFTTRELWQGYTVLDVADFDSDGVRDLLALDPTGLHLARGLGAGAFAPFALASTGSAAFHGNGVDTGDVDGDGDVDIVVADFFVGQTTRHLRLLENDGAGAFTPVLLSTQLAAGNDSSVRVIDFDLDGRLDVVAAPDSLSFYGYGVMSFRQRADGGGFEAPIVQLMLYPTNTTGPATPARFGAADLDGDGDVDLLTNRIIQNTANRGTPRGLHLQLGAGLPGDGGIRPLLGGVGPFTIGEPAKIRLRAAAPGTTGRMTTSIVAGIPEPLFPGGGAAAIQRQRIQVITPFTTSGVAGGADGSGTWELAFTVPPYVLGQTREYVAYVDDASGSARSNALYVVYGP